MEKDIIPTYDFNNLKVFQYDHYLKNYQYDFQIRLEKFQKIAVDITNNEGGLIKFAQGYKDFGFNFTDEGIQFREWLPAAQECYLFGEFNNWDRKQYKLTKNSYGVFEIFLPKDKTTGQHLIQHNTKVKIHILGANNQWQDKIPAWINYAVQPDGTSAFEGVLWNPSKPYVWKHNAPPRPVNLKIYEAHIGMAGIEPQVHSYKHFQDNVLHRIKKLGYNCVQFMAIAEHAYYGSFGYHVTNFFAISSRYGTPEELKELVDTAHGMGLYVIMDLIHSHASSNILDGINQQDGSDSCYFHGGEKGNHPLWDSKIFNYSSWEVIRFLLSNLTYFLQEYKFDGYRFDGITSMMYHHHGKGTGFTGNYNEYFSMATDIDALVYLMLANYVIHKINPAAITIAEDVSGYPTLGAKIEDGGLGFDYRLAMAIPDHWIKLLKEKSDDDWDMAGLSWTLINRRYDENVIAYCESHDQALVGDKTISMWLFDKEVYYEMSLLKPETLIVHRGMQLHKMIRLMTLALGGDGYLCFMGNEFGHPEWIDFPREGNGWSYQHCRRRWDLVDDTKLRFHQLNNFDIAMVQLEEKYKWLNFKDNFVSENNQNDKIIVFERGNLLFVFNFHPTKSFENYRIGTQFPYEHRMILNTDEAEFGGHKRLNNGQVFPILKETWHNRNNHIQIYIPSRTAIVFEPIKN